MLNSVGTAGIRSSKIKTLWGLLGTCVLMLLVPQVHAAVGRTEGLASVNAIGAAQYEIPLRVLPGTNGLQPSLSLQYRSDRENGIVGMGFAVTGFSAITRCNKTFAQDGTPAGVTRAVTDALCLEDQRLRLVSGSPGMAGSVYRHCHWQCWRWPGGVRGAPTRWVHLRVRPEQSFRRGGRQYQHQLHLREQRSA